MSSSVIVRFLIVRGNMEIVYQKGDGDVSFFWGGKEKTFGAVYGGKFDGRDRLPTQICGLKPKNVG